MDLGMGENLDPCYVMRPPLGKKSFPVSRVGKKKSQSGGLESFFFSNFIFYKVQGEKV